MKEFDPNDPGTFALCVVIIRASDASTHWNNEENQGYNVDVYGPFRTGEDAMLYADTLLVWSLNDVTIVPLSAPETE